jgi:hypothetical protein
LRASCPARPRCSFGQRGGPAERAGHLAALDRYPYGCNRADRQPRHAAVYLNDVALRAGLAANPTFAAASRRTIAGVLANHSSSGAFG